MFWLPATWDYIQFEKKTKTKTKTKKKNKNKTHKYRQIFSHYKDGLRFHVFILLLFDLISICNIIYILILLCVIFLLFYTKIMFRLIFVNSFGYATGNITCILICPIHPGLTRVAHVLFPIQILILLFCKQLHFAAIPM